MEDLDKNTEESNRHVGYKIYQTRLMLNLSRADLAQHVDISKESLAKYEQGLIQIPEGNLELISKRLKKPVDYFYKIDHMLPLPPIIDKSGNPRAYIRLVKKLAKLTNHNQQKALGVIIDGLLEC
jgi:transcriptional regulator with XRE-family HTH domain